MDFARCLVILAATVVGQDEPREDVRLRRTIYACDFGPASDADRDGWPDRWRRHSGPGFPRHTRIRITSEHEAFARPASKPTDSASETRPVAGAPPITSRRPVLTTNFEGGGAHISTPRVAVSPHFSYELTAAVRTQGVARNDVRVGLDFLDEQGKVVRTEWSTPVQRAGEWTTIRVGPTMSGDPAIRYASASLQVRGGEREDLRGVVACQSIEIHELPQLRVSLGRTTSLFEVGETITADCHISSFAAAGAMLRCRVIHTRTGAETIHNEPLAFEEASPSPASDDASPRAESFHRRVTWTLPQLGPGHYQVVATLLSNDRVLLEQRRDLALLAEMPRSATGEFGWSLKKTMKLDDPIDWAGLLPRAGLHWVKTPAWIEATDARQLDDLAALVERLGLAGVETVGGLESPPPEAREAIGEGALQTAATTFADATAWRPTLDPVFMRLALRIRWWQLGDDADWGFVGFNQARERVRDFRDKLSRYGSDLRFGLPWCLDRSQPDGQAPWRFVTLDTDPAATADELEALLPAHRAGETQAWVLLRALAEGEYDETDRARDLVMRMASARRGGAKVAMFADPFAPATGLMRPDGSPSSLFLPWRTTACLLAGCEHVGSLEFPNGSKNLLFARGPWCVAVVWNDRKTTERLWLGEAPSQIDADGRARTLEASFVDDVEEHEFEVGPEPTFLVGLDGYAARFSANLKLESTRLASVFGREQKLAFSFRNDFPTAVSGRIQWRAPAVTKETPTLYTFRAAAGESRPGRTDIRLHQEASTGPQPLWADVELSGEKRYRFRVYRDVHIGIEDVEVSIETRVEATGELVVQIHAANQSSRPIDFACSLFPKDRRRERRQLAGLGAERRTLEFALPDGEALLGTDLYIKMEEIGGDRIINQRVVVHR